MGILGSKVSSGPPGQLLFDLLGPWLPSFFTGTWIIDSTDREVDLHDTVDIRGWAIRIFLQSHLQRQQNAITILEVRPIL